jgi:signal transduction histidine kinase
LPRQTVTSSTQVFSDEFRAGLVELTRGLGPLAEKVDALFEANLRRDKVIVAHRELLAEVSPGGLVNSLRKSKDPLVFFGRVHNAGVKLAKWNFPPAGLVAALQLYEDAVDRKAPDLSRLRGVREQLSFCTLLTLNDAYYRVREAETRKLEELFQLEVQAPDPQTLSARYMEALAGFLEADAASLHCVCTPKGRWIEVARVGKAPAAPSGDSSPLLNVSKRSPKAFRSKANPHWNQKFKSIWHIPIPGPDGPRGLLEFAFKRQTECLPRDRSLMESIGERCLLGVQRLQLIRDLADRESKLRQLAEHMLHVEEAERRRISRELHDDAGQSLVCIRLQLEMIEMALPSDYADLRSKLAETRDVTEKTILEIRRLIADLSPVVLDQFGLAAAVRQLLKRLEASAGVQITLDLGSVSEIPSKTQMVVYRIIQECCNNIAKHSRARRVNISLTLADETLGLRVWDDGVGFDVVQDTRRKDSFGLAGIRERVALLGGKFHIVSHPDGMRKKGRRGTEVLVEVPILPESTKENS